MRIQIFGCEFDIPAGATITGFDWHIPNSASRTENRMTHGPLRLPLSELLDRLSIELRKRDYGAENETWIDELRQELWGRLMNIRHEPNYVMAAVMGALLLGIRNADIANLEWQLRAGQHLSLEEHGRRALAIRAINDRRNEAKATLSKALGENVETKHYGYGDLLKATDLTLDVQTPKAEAGSFLDSTPAIGKKFDADRFQR